MFGNDNKPSPRDFFLNTAAMVALYVSATSLIGLLFQYINVLFPDPLAYWVDPYNGAVRGFLAALIVIFPLYVFLTRVLNQDVRKNPEKADLKVRKWLIYLTLFAAGATIVIDLVVLLNAFLGGELSTRFLLKALVVLVVIGGLFAYYAADLKGKWEREERTSKMIGAFVSLLVLVSVVAGFFIIGSPAEARLLRFDQQKVNDLQNIQWQILDHYQRTEALPENLDVLADPLSGNMIPDDPQTGKAYEYRATGELSFELCAAFNKETPEGSQNAYYPEFESRVKGDPAQFNWEHGAGEVCFSREIDPERYPPYSETR